MKNKIKNLIHYAFLILILLSCFKLEGQNFSRIDSIKLELFNYLSDNGIMEKRKSIKDYERRTYFFDLSQPDIDNIDSTGIYGFGPLSSNKKTYFVILDDYKYDILNPEDLSENIFKCIIFLKRNNTSEEITFKYIDKLLKVYRNNQKKGQGWLNEN